MMKPAEIEQLAHKHVEEKAEIKARLDKLCATRNPKTDNDALELSETITADGAQVRKMLDACEKHGTTYMKKVHELDKAAYVEMSNTFESNYEYEEWLFKEGRTKEEPAFIDFHRMVVQHPKKG